MAYFQLEVCSFVSISFLSFYWIDCFSFIAPFSLSQKLVRPWAFPFFHSVEFEIFAFFQLFSLRGLSVSISVEFEIFAFFSHFPSPVLLNWIHCCLSARSLFVREHFLSSILLNWVRCYLSARSYFVREHFLSSISLNWVHNRSKPPARRGLVFDIKIFIWVLSFPGGLYFDFWLGLTLVFSFN